MGWLSSIIGGLFGVGQQLFQNLYNRNEAQKNRDFQSQQADINRVFQSNEAALQRNWSSAEAERARDWNEEMYEKYNSLSGKVAQAEQAGVNPLFAVTGNATTPMSTASSSPSGASAGSVGTPGGATAASSFVDIIGAMLGFKKIQAETDLLKAETERNLSDAEKTRKESSWIDKLSEAELNHLLTSSDELESRLHLNDVTAGKVSSESIKLQKEAERLAKITDSEVRQAEANALIAEYEASIVKLTDNIDNDTTRSIVNAGILLLEKIADVVL